MLSIPRLSKFYRCWSVMGFLLLSGCNNTPNKNETAKPINVSGDELLCQQLQGVFEKSADGFKSIREQPNYHNKATLWKSSYQLIADSCEIWQWSDKYSYICSRVMPDKESAEAVYRQAMASINQCINTSSSHWQEQPIRLDNQGQEVGYSLNNDLRGSLKVVDTGGVFQDSWTVYFRVDSPDSMR